MNQIGPVTTPTSTPIAWFRLRLPSLGRDLLFVHHGDHIAIFWRMRDERGGGRPYGVEAGAPRWRPSGQLLPGGEDRNGGWSWGMTAAGAFWFQGSRARGSAHAQHAEEVEAGIGAPPHLAEVWP